MSGRTLRLGAAACFGVLLALGLGAATASWSSSDNSNNAVAVAGVLATPTGATATPAGSGAVTVSWTVPGGQLAGAQYKVVRTSGPGSPTTVCPATASPCSDTGLTAGTTYGYDVTSVLGAWTSPAAPASATTRTPTFTVTLSAGPYTAGTPISVATITAKVDGATDTTYVGAKTIDLSGLAASPSGQAASMPSFSATFAGGSASPSSSTFTSYLAGSNTLTLKDNAVPAVLGSATFNVTPAAASKLVFTSAALSGSASASANLGPATVQTQDQFSNPAPGTSARTVTLSSSSTGTKVFSLTSGGPSVTTVDIASGSSSASFFYGDTKAGAPTITAASSGLASGMQGGTITAAGALTTTMTQGNNQTASPSSAFATLLRVNIVDAFANPVSGASVTFTAPASGASGTFANGTQTTTVATDANGDATATTFTSNATAGAYNVSAAAPGTNTVNFSMTNGTPASVSTLVLANKTGGTAGKLDSGDKATITFSQALGVNSICSAWSNNTDNQTNSTATIRVTGDGHGGNNVLSVSSWSGCASFRVGSIDLGSMAYVTSGGTSDKPLDFTGSTIAYNAVTHAITITLGTMSTGGSSGDPETAPASIAAYTAPAGMLAANGAAVSTSPFSTASVVQF